jgi:alkanesulfonate monooxygenase SsuD/methylene tetrahydromethanopterin reductase-like flavin-dependent oxidoreductase (luciferase family)
LLHRLRPGVELGLGTGWNKAEHEAYEFPFPPMGERMELMTKQLELITGQWAIDSPIEPKPVQQPRPNLIVGGRGGPRSLRLAARFADEYNTVNKTAEECADIRKRLDEACAEEGRNPIPLSLMTGWLAGADHAELLDRAGRLSDWTGRGANAETFLSEQAPAALAGTLDELVERIEALGEAGVERLMLQHLLHRDLAAVEQIGREIVPAVA